SSGARPEYLSVFGPSHLHLVRSLREPKRDDPSIGESAYVDVGIGRSSLREDTLGDPFTCYCQAPALLARVVPGTSCGEVDRRLGPVPVLLGAVSPFEE